MADVTIGYKPSGNTANYGDATSGTMRGTTLPGRSVPFWISSLGGRIGKYGAANVSMRFAAYRANGSTWAPEAILGQTAAFTVGVAMLDSQSGGPYTQKPISAIPVPKSTPITLVALGTGGPWAHGQDGTAAKMYELVGLSGFPSPFVGPMVVRYETGMALWAVIEDNVAPTIRRGDLSPLPESNTIDDTPTILVPFADDNEALTGFAIGGADYLKAYQVEIWNDAKTTRLVNSGKVTATPAERSARAGAFTVPNANALPPGRYTARAVVYDHFDVASKWEEWKFTVVGAGSLVITAPTGRTNDTTPDFSWAYSHRQGLAMDKIVGRVENTKGVILRPDFTFDFSTNPTSPSAGDFQWGNTTWAALPAGYDYVFRGMAIDTDGQPSPWSAPLTFHVNAAPQTPNYREPLPGTVLTALPDLIARIADIDDASATLMSTWEIRKQGDADTYTYNGTYNTMTQRHRTGAPATVAALEGGYGVYEWRVKGTDPHGAESAWSTWLAFEYVAPPSITDMQPDTTVPTSNPPFSWTIDRAQVSYRLQLFDGATGLPVRGGDSGVITSATTAHNFASLLLRNGQQINAVLDVVTAGGIPGRIEWSFLVAYTPPPSITGLTATAQMGDWDRPNRPTEIKVDWEKVSTPVDEFYDYQVHRKNLGTGEDRTMASLSDINETEWIDDEAPSGAVLEYYVTQRVWNQLDIVESVPVTAQASVTVVSSVLSIVLGGSGRYVLHFWEDRSAKITEDLSIRTTWAAKPRAISGPTRYQRIQGRAVIIGDQGSTYQVSDRIAALRRLAEPTRTAAGKVAKPTLCYRDSRGRVLYGVLSTLTEHDFIHSRLYVIDFEFTETDFDRGMP